MLLARRTGQFARLRYFPITSDPFHFVAPATSPRSPFLTLALLRHRPGNVIKVTTMSVRHFLSLMDCTPAELNGLLRRAIELKDLRNRGILYEPLKNRVLGMIFEKASTRTRVSFEAGMIQLGGQSLFLPRATPSWVAASRSATPPSSCRAC